MVAVVPPKRTLRFGPFRFEPNSVMKSPDVPAFGENSFGGAANSGTGTGVAVGVAVGCGVADGTGVGNNENTAVAERSPWIVKLSGFTEPLAPPAQEENWKPEAGIAVRMTFVPRVYPPFWFADGTMFTEPPFTGCTETVRKTGVGVAVGSGVGVGNAENTAVIVVFESTGKLRGLTVPPASPDQDVNRNPEFGRAVSTTLVPGE